MNRTIVHADFSIERDFAAPIAQVFGAFAPKVAEERGCKAHYYDIVENERIVYAYAIYQGSVCIFVSLTTIQFAAHGAQTRLVLHEHGVFLDGQNTATTREAEVRSSIEKLAADLASVE